MAEDSASELPGQSDAAVDRLARWLAVLGACGVMIVSGAIVVDVLARWLFNSPILAVDDLIGLNVAVAIACCLPAGLVGRHLVTIRFLGRGLGLAATRWLECFGDVATLIFVAMLAWRFVIFSRDMTETGLGTTVLQIDQAPWWWAVTAILAACVAFQFVVVARGLRAAAARHHSPLN